MALDALIFDVDGTLADNEECHRAAFNQAFKAMGLEWYWNRELYHDLLEVFGGKERLLYYWQQYKKEKNGEKDFLLNNSLNYNNIKEFIAEIHKIKTTAYNDLLKQGAVAPRPGVKRMIDEAKRSGLKLAIATTTTAINVDTLVGEVMGIDVDATFDVIACGDCVKHKKPAPDVYHYTIEALKADPRHCLAIEDSEKGLLAASAAGIPTVITYTDYTQQQDFSQARLVTDHLGDPETPCQIKNQRTPWNTDYITLEHLATLL